MTAWLRGLVCRGLGHRWVLACERAHDVTFGYCLRCRHRQALR